MRVSVLLPVFNAAATLPACLRSLTRQTLTDWECVLVDDGSGDASPEVAAAAARRDSRITVLATPHRGIVAALNEGLARCRAPLIARMDADDVMHRERLVRQVAALETDPSLDGVASHVRIVPRRGMQPRRREYEAWLNGLRTAGDIARDAFVECPVAHPTLVLRASAFGGGYRAEGWPEDYDLVLRILTRAGRIGTVPDRLLLWRDAPGRLSRRDPRYALERFTACKAHFLAESFLASSSRYVLWGYGATGRALRRALADRGRQASHIVEIKKGRIGQVIQGAPVVPPEALASLRGVPLVVSVARAGPRMEIRAALAGMEFVELRDFVCAA